MVKDNLRRFKSQEKFNQMVKDILKKKQSGEIRQYQFLSAVFRYPY
jgi:hypothetical protein